MTFPEHPQYDAPPPLAVDDDVLGRRLGAGLIDVAILALAFVVFSVAIGESSAGDGAAAVNLSGGPFLLYLLAVFAYYFTLETTRGQTVGKRLTGVRVVRQDGARASTGAIAGRTALRLVDGLFLYLVGLVVVLATGRRRARLGDLVAGTRVVRA